MTTRFSSILIRVAGLLAVAAASAAVAVALTPRLWLSSALLGPVSDAFEAERTVDSARSGRVISVLASDPDLLALFDIEQGPGALSAVSAVFDREVTVVAGPKGVWIAARDRDGARAQALVQAIAEVTAAVETEGRECELLRMTDELEREAAERNARIAALVSEAPVGDDAIALEVHQARVREAAARLADVEEDLAECRARADAPTLPWTVEDGAGADQMLLQRRFGPAATAAVVIPLLLVVVGFLVTGRVRDC